MGKLSRLGLCREEGGGWGGEGLLQTKAGGSRNCALRSMLSRACRAEHPHARTERVWASKARL